MQSKLLTFTEKHLDLTKLRILDWKLEIEIVPAMFWSKGE
jgi:hypothetical protein